MPRIPLITSKDQIPASGQTAAESIIGSRGGIHGPFVAFLHSPEIAQRVAHLGAYVRFEGTLDMRVRVLAAGPGSSSGSKLLPSGPDWPLG